MEALVHPFFDELRDPNTRLPNSRFLPPLFNFKPNGKFSQFLFCLRAHFLSWCWDQYLMLIPLLCFSSELKGIPGDIVVKLIPEHARKQCSHAGLWELSSWLVWTSLTSAHFPWNVGWAACELSDELMVEDVKFRSCMPVLHFVDLCSWVVCCDANLTM